MKKRIVIFASGSGSNARKIMEHFRNSSLAEVVLIASNKSDAGVLQHAADFAVPTFVFNREQWSSTSEVIDRVLAEKPNLIVLAGFLWKVPQSFVSAFPEQIINIHPALLPKYGGKGMYGHFVHEAVSANGEEESGITIHKVNENYDEGATLFQASVNVKGDSASEVERKVRALEIIHFAPFIEQYLSQH